MRRRGGTGGSGGGCCGGVTPPLDIPLTCCPLGVPQKDLTLSYSSSGPAGNGSVTLTFTPGIPGIGGVNDSWAYTGCIPLGMGGLSGFNNSISFSGTCNSGDCDFATEWYFSSNSCTGTPNHAAYVLTDYTGSPFHLHHHVGPGDGYPNDDYASYGFTDFYIDSSGNSSFGCRYNFFVTGCSGGALAGSSVSLWTNSGKTVLISSGTTDSSGSLTLVNDRFLSTYYEVSHSRFSTASGSIANPSSTGVTTVPLTIVSGYHCNSTLCAVPLANSLTVTNSILGSTTLTYTAGGTYGNGWYGTKSYSYPGCNCCPSKTVTVTFVLLENGQYSEHWVST